MTPPDDGRHPPPLAATAAAGPTLSDRLPILATVTLWAFQVPAMHALGSHWDAATLNFARYALAAVAFAALAAVLRRPPVPRPDLRAGLPLGVLFAGFGILFTIGSVIGDPIAVVTGGALMPLTASLVNWAIVGDRPPRALLLALFLVIPGAMLAAGIGAETGPGRNTLIALGCILAAQTMWSTYSLMVPRWLPGHDQVGRTRLSVLWSLPFHSLAFAVALAAGWTAWDWRASPETDGLLVVAITLGPLVLGVVLWNVSVSRIGMPLSALYLNLGPAVGVAIAWGFGTTPTPLQLLGVALTTGGMALAQWKGTRRPPPAPVPARAPRTRR